MLRHILSRAMAALCSAERTNLCNCGRGHHNKHFCEIGLSFGPVDQEEMSFKDISYLDL